jgi:DNA helicase MCM8
VECEVVGDLVDSVVPGDVVTVSGIVKFTTVADGAIDNHCTENNILGGKGKNACVMHVLYLDCHAIAKSSTFQASAPVNPSDGPTRMQNAYEGCDMKETIEFDYRDYYAIEEISREPNLFKLLVNSLCPAIYGHEVVKGVPAHHKILMSRSRSASGIVWRSTALPHCRSQ